MIGVFVNMPKGWQLASAELRNPKEGEHYLKGDGFSGDTIVTRCCDKGHGTNLLTVIVERKE